MSSDSVVPPYYYIAYIDESGDPNIDRVRPIDNPGSSEWLVLGATLIEASNELGPVEWVRSILGAAESRQPQLHYRRLHEWQKPIVCQKLASFPVGLFAVTSNKKNMRQYTNERAAAKGSPLTTKQTIYNWCVRLILERVTHCVLRHSMRIYGEPRYVKIIFSRRNGHSYGHTFAYQELLKAQARSGTTYLNKRTIRWEVMNYNLLDHESHDLSAGLQLADVVAAAFYQAVDVLPPDKRYGRTHVAMVRRRARARIPRVLVVCSREPRAA